VDGLGNPLRFCLTAGQRHDITQAQHLLEGFDFERLIADRGYAAAHFIEYVLDRGIEPWPVEIIPVHFADPSEAVSILEKALNIQGTQATTTAA